MTQRNFTIAEPCQFPFGQCFGNHAVILMMNDCAVMIDRNACTDLSSVLQGIQGKIGFLDDIHRRVCREKADHTAFIV